jgi:hypothetical protein
MNGKWARGINVPTSKAIGCPVRKPITRTQPNGTKLQAYEYGRCMDAAGATIYVAWNERPMDSVHCAECEIDLSRYEIPTPIFSDNAVVEMYRIAATNFLSLSVVAVLKDRATKFAASMISDANDMRGVLAGDVAHAAEEMGYIA